MRRRLRRLQKRLAAQHPSRGGNRRSGGRPDERPPVEIHRFVGDFRAPDVRRRFNQHPAILLRNAGRFFGVLLLRAGPGKDAVHHVVIPFVARELIELVPGLLQANRRRPRLRPRRRVVDRNLVIDPVRADTREPFNQVQVFGGSQEAALGGKIGGVDDQRLPLPAAPRIAVPLTNARRKMRTPVQGMTRASWIASMEITTYPAVCRIWK